MIQSFLLNTIQEIVGSKVSLNDIIAATLNISYDAAHRRASGKSKLSLEDAVLLARKFNISIDELATTTTKNIIVVEKTSGISNEKDLEEYFKSSRSSLLGLAEMDGEVLYSAKDIPLFYLLKGDILTRFKIYVWLKLLDPSFASKIFTNYQPPLSLLKAAKDLGNVYTNIQMKEIWDVTTINSTLKQIHFYFEAGLLSITDALALCENLKGLINRTLVEIRKFPSNLCIYYNELLLMNNQVLVNTTQGDALYVPFTMLSYFLCQDIKTTKQAAIYFDKQIKHSKRLNDIGEKEQNRFANKMLQKINALESIISAETLLDFQ